MSITTEIRGMLLWSVASEDLAVDIKFTAKSSATRINACPLFHIII